MNWNMIICLAGLLWMSPMTSWTEETEVVVAARQFLASLDADQRALATFEWDSTQRKDWHFIPKTRKGLPLKDLAQDQQHLAYGLLNTVMSQEGALKALTIMSFERILWELENKAPHRDPAMYHFSFFGAVDSESTWGLSIEGHHFSLNVTVAGGQLISGTPSFYGTNPDIILSGPRKGMQILSEEQSLAFELVESLSISQRQKAILPGGVPEDILTAAQQQVEKFPDSGLEASDLNATQKRTLIRLIREYIFRQSPTIATAQMRDIRNQDSITFSWVGKTDQFSPHYYRIQGKDFIIEYANVQNDANHAHAVLRSPSNDFGASWIAEHVKEAHP
jgi:ADP-ribose pyrophosphatase YjhB (NUDIX family)